MDDVRLITTDRGDVGQRLDLVLQRHLRDVTAASRTRIQKWIENECVTVNQAPATRPSRRISHGDVVRISLPFSARRAVMAAEEIPLDVIYEDDYLVAINKPAGNGRSSNISAPARHIDECTALARPALAGGCPAVARRTPGSTHIRRPHRRQVACGARRPPARPFVCSFGEAVSGGRLRPGECRAGHHRRPPVAQPPEKTDRGDRLGVRCAKSDRVRTAAPNQGLASRRGTALLPSRDWPHAPNPCPSGRARMADCRRHEVWAAALEPRSRTTRSLLCSAPFQTSASCLAHLVRASDWREADGV